MSLLLDTDILIDYLRQAEKETLFTKICKKHSTLYISGITITELWAGKSIEKKMEKQKAERLLGKLKIVIANTKISKKAGDLLRKYQQFTIADALIAATAIDKKTKLATFNKKHFENIKGLKLL